MLVQWANRKEINSIEKCKELHLGMKNEKTQYQLNSKWSTGTKLGFNIYGLLKIIEDVEKVMKQVSRILVFK